MSNVEVRVPAWLNAIAKNRRLVSYLLLVVALVPLGFAIWWGIQTYKAESAVLGKERQLEAPMLVPFTLCFWMAFLFLSMAAAGLYGIVATPKETSELDLARSLVLGLGGAAGLATAIGACVLAYAWWPDLTGWLSDSKTKQLWKGAVVLLVLFFDLALMFVILQGCRTEERSNAFIRRLLYGYNTVLTGLLLLVILAVVGALLYTKFPQSIDFTTSNIYTLSPRSKSILQSLEKPTKVYVLMSPRVFLYGEVTTLLVNCREVNPRIEVEEKSPDLNDDWIEEMSKVVPSMGRVGLLVAYGEEGQQEYRFINAEDLFSADDRRRMRRDPDEKEGFRFKGEDALISELNSLTEEKQKPIVYFTQGNGELDLNNRDANRLDEGIGLLGDKLKTRHYEVKPLTLDVGAAKVPDDARIVVIAGPRREMPAPAIKALRDYMNSTAPGKSKGKMLVMLEPPTAKGGTGLEGFLKEFSVDVPNERLLAVHVVGNRLAAPAQIGVITNPEMRDNKLASAFRTARFDFIEARPVQPASAAPQAPMGSRYQAETLLVAPGLDSRYRQIVWAEKNLTAPPLQLAHAVYESFVDGKPIKASAKSIPVAVTVSEGDPQDPHAGMMGAPPPKQTPRLVVFGDATFASNVFIAQADARENFDMVAGSLDWLRERTGSIGVPPKSRNLFVMGKEPEPWPLTWIPTVLMCAGIVGLGTGVWVVRRR
jgi:hypothetical protein